MQTAWHAAPHHERRQLAALAILLALAACSSMGGPTGAGAAGSTVEPGTSAEPEQEASTPSPSRGPSRYIGTARCRACHEDIAASFLRTAHPFVLARVEAGAAPTRPMDDITGGMPGPPPGLTWEDIAYVIGGFAWKTRYIRTDGFIATGGEGGMTQWNLANALAGKGGTWVPYHPGEREAYTCGGCHSTGWVPCPVGDRTCAHQDGLPGMAGSFAEAGVQCEACHGPASLHADHPDVVDATIDRSAELCGKCHVRDTAEAVSASGGFIRHRQQYEELILGAKHSMVCVDCHDPHRSVKLAGDAAGPTRGIRVGCVDCHTAYDANQKSEKMARAVACIDCHMPRIGKSAWGDAERFAGDLRTHFFRIEVDPAQAQFTEDGTYANPFVTTDWACRSCHRNGGEARALTTEEVGATAAGYHTAP